MTRKEWFDHCMQRGTSGDQVHNILKDWEKEERRLAAVQSIIIPDARQQFAGDEEVQSLLQLLYNTVSGARDGFLPPVKED